MGSAGLTPRSRAVAGISWARPMAPLGETACAFQRLSCQISAESSAGLTFAAAAAWVSAAEYCGGTGAGPTSV